MGSSLILRMTAESAFKDLGIEAKVEATTLAMIDGRSPDVIITTPALADSITSKQSCVVITVTNFVDKEALKAKIQECLINKGGK